MNAPLLFIGSTVADVVVRVPHLPVTGEDEHVLSQQTNLGGCACNAFLTARKAGDTPCVLFSPVGTGVWGDWVRKALADRGIVSAVPDVQEENGCCYCLVEETGERTFLSHHGTEYLFRRSWFDAVDLTDYAGVYLCGLEVEERTGDEVIAALEAQPPRRLYFAPGPRVCRIHPEKMARVLALHPVMHLNEQEAVAFTRAEDVAEAARIIRGVTENDVVITLGGDGAYVLCDGFEGVLPGYPATVQDTIGAGDSHIGALMAAEADGYPLHEAVRWANRISARVVQTSGVELEDAVWRRLWVERD